VYNPEGYFYLDFKSQSEKFISDQDAWIVTVTCWLKGYAKETRIYVKYIISIRHYCSINVIKSLPQVDIYYEIMDPLKIGSLNSFKMNQSE
jgi:hypothetical protein